MNLSDAVNIRFGGKTVESIRIDGRTVYNGLNIVVSSDKSFILTGETATVTVTCEDLPDTEIELYKVINMTRTLWDTLTTDSTGTASKVYTGTGAGEVGFVAVYDEKDSNIVVIDDYVPAVDSVGLSISNSNVSYGTSVTLTATVKDQHNQNISSGTVTFKDGSTTVGTGSVSSGVATLTISTLAVGSHSLTAEISSKTSSAVSLSVNKLNTATTITPPTLYYKDEFDVEGTLKDSNGTGIVGATVTLLWNDGSDHTATATTGTGGAYQFHRDAPTSIREYTFKVTYAGGDNYNASETGTSSVTVNKELTVINITSPTSGTTVNNDFTVTGTLLDDEGNVLDTSATVSLKVLNPISIIGTFDVESDGSFSISVDIDDLSNGSNTLQVKFGEKTNYATSNQEFTVVKSSFDGMSIEKSAGKDILSYADSGATPETEYCTVRTQLKSGSSSANISGVPVVFGAYQNDVLVTGSEQTVNTDANGQATYTYTSAGRGDIVVKAVPDNRILLTKTYELQDCTKVWKLDSTTQYQQLSGVPNAVSISDGVYMGKGSYLKDTFTNTGNWILECDVMFVGGASGVGLMKPDFTARSGLKSFKLNASGCVYYQNNGERDDHGVGCIPYILNEYTPVKFIKQNTTITVEFNEEQVSSSAWSHTNASPLTLGIDNWDSGNYVYVKNLRLKPL